MFSQVSPVLGVVPTDATELLILDSQMSSAQNSIVTVVFFDQKNNMPTIEQKCLILADEINVF